MKLIPLTQGQFAKVDDEDFDILNQWKWCAHFNHRTKTFYAERLINGKRTGNGERNKNKVVSMHRFLLNLNDSNIHGDHIDHDTLNNQRLNIRPATRSQNMANKIKKVGTSKYLGVYWNKSRNKWHASIRMNGRTKHIGLFDNEINAAKAYNTMAAKIHGEFAQLNRY